MDEFSLQIPSFLLATFAGALVAGLSGFAFGLVAFGFLGMGPVTIAVDSYGPVTDNAQSVFELSQIEAIPNIKAEIKKEPNPVRSGSFCFRSPTAN